MLGEVACISPTGSVSGEMEEQVHFCPSLPTRPGNRFHLPELWLWCGIIPEKCFLTAAKTT